MKPTGLVAILTCFAALLAAPTTMARDTKVLRPIADAMATPDAKARLNMGVQFFFGNTAHPPVAQSFGEFMSNKKTNGTNKSDKEACEWAFLSAMLSFQQRAVAVGGNAVINIKSYYRQNEISSETQFECGSGALMSGVTFKGEVVKLQP
jgi:uncharacterized protein YbjQ (UPF0145 family)